MFLGIDLGTSEVKAMLLRDQHQVLGWAGSALQVLRPQVGHSEQQPEAWWQATLAVLSQLRLAHPKEYAQVKGIGLSGQMHGAVLLDAQGQVLRPAILWNDTRSAQECRDMMAQMPALAELGGSLAMPGFTAPKLLWLKRHEPEVFRRVAKVLLPKDYIRYRLTGEYVSDMSDASGTLWLDVRARAWSEPLLALTGLSLQHMPRLIEGEQSSGTLSQQVAHDIGLSAQVLVAGGAGDNAASAVGLGAVEPGQGFLSLGTSGVLFVTTKGYQPNAPSATHAFCHAVAERWHQMSVMLSAASALQWASGFLTGGSAAELERKASALSADERARSPLFLPYLGGERTPHNDADVRASWHGLSFDTQAAQLGYAVMEGVSFGLKDGLRALQAAGSQVQSLSLVGGGARSAMWAQQLASALDVPIITHAESALGGALGAARLGWLACGGEARRVCTTPAVQQIYSPQASEQALLNERYTRFRTLYSPAVVSTT
jgi:xylulokinase